MSQLANYSFEMKTEHKSDRKVKRKTTAARDFKEEPKSSTNQNSATSNHSGSKPMDVLTMTLNAQKREEEEAIHRKSDDDYAIFSNVCGEIRSKLRRIKEMKDTNASQEEIMVYKQEVCMLFLELKKLNRLDKLRCKYARDHVSETKAKVDFKHLQQQNLLYEAMYLQKEISKCLEFKSKDEGIELISEDKFYEEAPEELISANDIGNDPHKLHLARLQWELMDRKNLAKSLEEKTKMKEKITEAIMSQKHCLENLKPMLKVVVEACQPLHQELNLPLQSTDIRHSNAEFLPRALYILYVNSCAAKESSDFKYDVEIDGNVEEAKNCRDDFVVEDEEAIDSDTEDRKGKRHRKSLTDKRDAALKKLTSCHPLFVIITFTDGESKAKLRIEFYYLTTLKIICVKSKISSDEMKHIDILDESLLDFLEEGDDGRTSPNPGNSYYLQLHGFHDFKCIVSKVGLSYRWAQRLAGLYFLPSLDSSTPSHIHFKTDEIVSLMDKTLRSIGKRFRSRLLLDQQFMDLEKGMVSLPSDLAKNSFTKLSCTIKEWSPMTTEEFNKHQSVDEIRSIGVIDENSFYYRLVIERGSAQLRASVAISYAYPEKAPLFLLNLNWQSERTSRNNIHLRDLEELTNVTCVEQTPDRNRILLMQVHVLCVGFDVFLETDESSSGVEGPREFPKGRIFARLTSGRNHSKPFRYCPEYEFFTT